MRRTATALFALLLLFVSAPARAFVPQTINVDGVNDFDPQNLLDDDRLDTQPGCTPVVNPLDLGRVYVTNDANYLYIGIEFSQTCYCDMNLGMALDVGSAGGGVTDMFGRKIGWANVPFKPDFMIYDVTPTSCNTFNYERIDKDTLGAWTNISTRVNPSWGSGANGLGIVDSLNFKELKIPLGILGVSTGTTMHLEFWVTQEGALKGPLDALASDDIQMSHPNVTSWDTANVVQMTTMLDYVVQNAVDNVAPTIVNARAVGFATLPNGQFGLTTNKIDVQFSEPVDVTTSQVTSNYTFAGPVSRTISSAVRDGAAPNIVHLTLSTGISANAAAYTITASGVNDVAGNPIVLNGSTNVGGFFIQNLVFNGNFKLGLCNGSFVPADTFAVEGSLTPLTFDLCDSGLMTDANADSIYTLTVPFCLVRDRVTLIGTSTLEWKFSHSCSTYEPLAGNRVYNLSSANGATVNINQSWNNDDPANFLTHAVDVVFQVNAAAFNPGVGDIITLLGSALPLSFSQPGVLMRDDGVAPDATAGDKIYAARVTFPSCAPKNLNWKVDFNGAIECLGQGDRNVFMNDALFSSANPIVLPARGIDRCSVSDKPVAVVFQLDTHLLTPMPSDTFAVMGASAPLTWTWPATGAARLADDGVAPDLRAGDRIYSGSIVFPDSTPLFLEYKYSNTGTLECFGSPNNRTIRINDVSYSVGTPMNRHFVDTWDVCNYFTAVGPEPGRPANAGFGALRPVMPNPVARRASFAFELYRAGRATLTVYDVSGRRVARLIDGNLPAGPHTATWDGVGEGGLRLASGVYLYELAMGNDRLSRRMILVR